MLRRDPLRPEDLPSTVLLDRNPASFAMAKQHRFAQQYLAMTIRKRRKWGGSAEITIGDVAVEASKGQFTWGWQFTWGQSQKGI